MMVNSFFACQIPAADEGEEIMTRKLFFPLLKHRN
jgi:hypothetical protein